MGAYAHNPYAPITLRPGGGFFVALKDRREKRDRMAHPQLELYDTTLRDGSQQEGSRSRFRTSYGLPRCSTNSGLGTWKAAGRGPTRRTTSSSNGPIRARILDSDADGLRIDQTPRGNVERDPQLHALLEAETEVICIVGKSWDYHVREALRA